MLTIGDSATLGDWEISVSDFYFTERIDDSSFSYFQADDGNQYAVVGAKIVNNGKEADTFLPLIGFDDDVSATLYYIGEYKYTPTSLLGLGKDLSSQTVNPLASKEGIIVFSVPGSIANDDSTFSLTLSLGRDEVTFSLQ